MGEMRAKGKIQRNNYQYGQHGPSVSLIAEIVE